jgi:YHS domain-containing protein
LMAVSLSAWAGGACCAGKSAAKTADGKIGGACCASKTAPTEGAAVASSEVMSAGPSPSEVKAQVNCPVMGVPASKSIYVDYNGKRVYFCCNACVSAFKADPEKYMKKLADEGVQVEDAPPAE